MLLHRSNFFNFLFYHFIQIVIYLFPYLSVCAAVTRKFPPSDFILLYLPTIMALLYFLLSRMPCASVVKV